MTCLETRYVKRYICAECGMGSTSFRDLATELRSIEVFLPDGHYDVDNKECTGSLVFVVERITSYYRLTKNGLHPDGLKAWIRGGTNGGSPIPKRGFVYQRELGFFEAAQRWHILKEAA